MKTISAFSKAMLGLAFASSALLFVPVAAGAAPEASAAVPLPDFADLVDKAGPAVVNIRTTEKVKLGQQDDQSETQELLRRFFGPNVPLPQQPQPQPRQRGHKQPTPDEEEEVDRGIGSGFIISSDGYVLTNAHVIDGADEVHVTLTDKREFKAKVIGADTDTDIALLKIDGKDLPRVTLGDSDKIRAGEWAIAIGSPFNLDNTVTAGIISSKAREIGDYLKLIQTDVAVNPGNSGGPLLNMRGEVVGINSQIFSSNEAGGYMGISFAVPINDAIRVSEQLKASGKVTRGLLGIQIQDVTREIAESLNLPKAQGAQVVHVEPGSPAEKAGILAGDIVIKFNGVTVETRGDLRRMAGSTKPGTRVSVTVWRKGAAHDVNVVLTELEGDKATGKKDGKHSKKDDKEQVPNALGLITSDLTDAQKKDLDVGHGVVVELADGAAAAAGLRPGDVISRVKDTDITDSKQFNSIVAKLEPKKAVPVLVTRAGASQFVLLKPSAP